MLSQEDSNKNECISKVINVLPYVTTSKKLSEIGNILEISCEHKER